MTVVSQRELTLTSSRRCLAAAKRGRRRSHRPVLPVFFALALGPHPQRELTLTLRRGVAWARRSVAAGAPVSVPIPAVLPFYFAVITKCPRRFCCQHDSLPSLQNGCSLPLLTMVTRLAAMPRLTR